MTAPTLFVPPAELVASGWLSTFAQFASVDIGQGLKTPWSTWTSDYAIVVSALPSVQDAYVPMRTRDVRIDMFGRPVGEGQTRKTIPANRLKAYGEFIIDEAIHFVPFPLSINGASYYDIRLLDVSPSAVPIRTATNDGGLGRISVGLTFLYIAIY